MAEPEEGAADPGEGAVDVVDLPRGRLLRVRQGQGAFVAFEHVCGVVGLELSAQELKMPASASGPLASAEKFSLKGGSC